MQLHTTSTFASLPHQLIQFACAYFGTGMYQRVLYKAYFMPLQTLPPPREDIVVQLRSWAPGNSLSELSCNQMLS